MTDRHLAADMAAHARRTAPQANDARLAEIRERHQLKIDLGLTGNDPARDPVGFLLARVDQLTAERNRLRGALSLTLPTVRVNDNRPSCKDDHA